MYKYLSVMFVLSLVTACNPMADKKSSKLSFRAPSTAAENKALSDYNSELQMAPRSYIESVLLEVFDAKGTNAEKYVRTEIYDKIEFGGACDQYEAGDTGAMTVTYENEKLRCVNGIGVVQRSTNNPMRYSLATKVCERLVVDKDRLEAVRKKIYSKNKWDYPNDSSINTAWELFYPATPIHIDVKNALVDIRQSAKDDEQAWQAIILTLCVSPQWQVL